MAWLMGLEKGGGKVACGGLVKLDALGGAFAVLVEANMLGAGGEAGGEAGEEECEESEVVTFSHEGGEFLGSFLEGQW